MSTPHFPAVGHVYEANFGSWVHHLHFESEAVMTLTTAEGPFKGTSETVQIAVMFIRPGVFLTSWQEKDKTTVVHVEDFENSIVHTNITERSGAFIRRSGTLKQLR
jgi:MoaF-like